MAGGSGSGGLFDDPVTGLAVLLFEVPTRTDKSSKNDRPRIPLLSPPSPQSRVPRYGVPPFHLPGNCFVPAKDQETLRSINDVIKRPGLLLQVELCCVAFAVLWVCSGSAPLHAR